jgi:hypothetical protein
MDFAGVEWAGGGRQVGSSSLASGTMMRDAAISAHD